MQTRNNLLFAAVAVILLVTAYLVSTQQDATTTTAANTSQPQQVMYESPEAAAKALYDVVKTHRPALIYTVLGPDSAKLLYTGDEVADQQMRDRFLTAYDTSMKIEQNSDSKATLLLGDKLSPFPFPLIKGAQGWKFDVKAGAEEIINRRIGENELFAIEFCLAYGDAQREYVEQDHDGDGLFEYAQKFSSTEGKRDGLYWPTEDGAPPSPLGALALLAKHEDYSKKDSGPAPYRGYHYRILTGQGKDAPGGAYDYIVNRHMIGGYALIAYPARWGASGVMSFICNHDGVVYQQNLGTDTAKHAADINLFNPDANWSKAE